MRSRADRAQLDKGAACDLLAYDRPSDAPAVRRYRQVLRDNKEVVIVRRADQTTEAYPVGEPIPDGIIVARRLPNGEMAWYTGTGSREDPASFRPVDTSSLKPPVFRSKE